jgi:hypothetical protein
MKERIDSQLTVGRTIRFYYSNFTINFRYRSDLSQDIASKILSCQVNPPIKFGLNTNKTVLITLEHNKVTIKHNYDMEYR